MTAQNHGRDENSDGASGFRIMGFELSRQVVTIITQAWSEMYVVESKN